MSTDLRGDAGKNSIFTKRNVVTDVSRIPRYLEPIAHPAHSGQKI